MMRAGEMRHVVRIQSRSAAQDVAGEQVVQWNTVAERRASMRRSVGSEVFTSAQRQGRVPTEFRLRFMSGVLPRMRLTLVSESPVRVYDILAAVDVDGRRETLLITAVELVEETP